MVGRGGNSRNWLSPLFIFMVNTLQYGKRKSGFKSSF